MKKRQKLVTDEQWELIAPLLPEPRRRRDSRGRPWASNRACFEGILWILQTGAAWRFLPDEFPSPATSLATAEAVAGRGRVAGCVVRTVGSAGRGRLVEVGRDVPGWQRRPGQKGGDAVGKTKRDKGTKWMVLVDGQGLPLGVRLEGASPAEATLAEATPQEVCVPRRPRQKPKRVIADAGYDSDPLCERLRKRAIELIAPYRKNNKRKRYYDGCKMRRYKRRWIVERTNAWRGQRRQLLVRHEHLLSIYYALFYLACFWITLRKCL